MAGLNPATVQPPSGGCVLKLIDGYIALILGNSAAFGRLRVETLHDHHQQGGKESAAFGRLRVETRPTAPGG